MPELLSTSGAALAGLGRGVQSSCWGLPGRPTHQPCSAGCWRPLLLPGQAPGQPPLLCCAVYLPRAAVSRGAGQGPCLHKGDGHQTVGHMPLSTAESSLTGTQPTSWSPRSWPGRRPTPRYNLYHPQPADTVTSRHLLSNLSLTALLSDPSSGSLPVPHTTSLGSSVLCPWLSGHPQVLTLEPEDLGDQIRLTGALAGCGLPWARWGRTWGKPARPPRTNSPRCRDPSRTLFTGPLSSQPPSDAGSQVRVRSGAGQGWVVPPSPVTPHRLPVCCPSCPSKPAEAEKEKAGMGPAQTLGCRDPGPSLGELPAPPMVSAGAALPLARVRLRLGWSWAWRGLIPRAHPPLGPQGPPHRPQRDQVRGAHRDQ